MVQYVARFKRVAWFRYKASGAVSRGGVIVASGICACLGVEALSAMALRLFVMTRGKAFFAAYPRGSIENRHCLIQWVSRLSILYL
jgi:hypoxanthine phosphoribosyltransferase